MWPTIKRKNNIGVSFNDDFWAWWGPTYMVYFNEELFNDTKDIKGIICMYCSIMEIEFNNEEIAMALEYQCGDFGYHSVLFSYEEFPKLKSTSTWNYYVYPGFDTDNDSVFKLYQDKLEGKSTDEMYLEYLEDTIFYIHYLSTSEREQFRKNIGLDLLEYRKYLEGVTKLLLSLPLEMRGSITKQLYDFSSFTSIIAKVPREYLNDKVPDIKIAFNYDYSVAISEEKKNDLNTIYQNSRDFFLDYTVQFEEFKSKAFEYDEESGKIIESEKWETCLKPIYGFVRNQNGKPVFEKKEDKKYIKSKT